MSTSTSAPHAVTDTMSIGELATRSGASPRMLRYYERQGLLRPSRADNSYRRYEPDAVVVVAQIRGLLDAGLSTETIRRILPCAHGAEPVIDPCPEMLSTLADELDRLDHRISNLAASRGALHRYLATASASLDPA